MESQAVVADDILKIIADVMRRSKYAKTEMCKNSPMTDNPPMVIVGRVHDESDSDEEMNDTSESYHRDLGLAKKYDVAMLPLIHKEDPYEAYTDIVGHFPIMPIEFILIIVEGYMREMKDKSLLEGLRQENDKGVSLKEDFQTNPFTDVVEGLVIAGVDWDEDKLYMSASTYRYDDFGVPQFSDVESDVVMLTDENREEMTQARFTNVMLQTITYLKLTMRAKAFHDLLSEAPDERN